MELKKLDKKVLTLWCVESLIAVICILLGAAVAIAFSNESIQSVLLYGLGIPAGIISLFIIVYPFLRYAFYSYGYNETRIVIKKGVIFKSSVTLPVKQIQDLHLYEGPIMLLMGLGGVSVSTAGSSFNIACINKKQAKLMVDELESYLNSRLGEQSNEEV